MTYIKIFLCCLMLCVLGILGCTDTTTGTGTSNCSGYGPGTGYKINLCVTSTILPQGGTTTLIASVRDAQNNPVNDSTKGVSFTSTWGATITADSSINLGVCNATYKAPANTNQPSTVVDQISATYQGAIARESIEVYLP